MQSHPWTETMRGWGGARHDCTLPDYVSQHGQLVDSKQYSDLPVLGDDILFRLVVQEGKEEGAPAGHFGGRVREWGSEEATPGSACPFLSWLTRQTHCHSACSSNMPEGNMSTRHIQPFDNLLRWLLNFTSIFFFGEEKNPLCLSRACKRT